MEARSAFVPFALAFFAAASASAADAQPRQAYAKNPGELLIDNERIVVQKFVFQPGESEGPHTHPGNQLLVYIKGGTWTSNPGQRSTRWTDGRVVWQDEVRGAGDHPAMTNTGNAPIEVLWVTLKPTASNAARRKDLHVNYPNIPGEDLLENDLVIVQRFLVKPGEFEGVHEHPGNQLYVHIKDGKWEVQIEHPPDASPGRRRAGSTASPTANIGRHHRLVPAASAQRGTPVRKRGHGTDRFDLVHAQTLSRRRGSVPESSCPT